MTHRWLRVLKRPDDQVKERCRRCGMVRRLALNTVWAYDTVGDGRFTYWKAVPPCRAT